MFPPAYSPDLNLIERLWKFLRTTALNRWHEMFEAMQAAVGEVLDHLDRYRPELDSLMTEGFHILEDEELPLAPAARAKRHGSLHHPDECLLSSPRGMVRPIG